MFDFDKFYNDLLTREYQPNNHWNQFPRGRLLQFKEQTLSLLKDNLKTKNSRNLEVVLALIFYDGADTDYTDDLLDLLDQYWHTCEEDIIRILEIIKDPKSVDKLYELAVNIPDWDEMRGMAKKCMWALNAINNEESFKKLLLLQQNGDPIIKETAEELIKRKFDGN